MYPTIAQSDIKRILQYGWKAFYLHNSYGGDVLVNQGKLWFYSGYLMKNSLRWFEYYQHKMRTKLRVMYKRKKIKWDGYYYIALTRPPYEAYLAEKHTGRGRPKKNFIFEKVMFFKIYLTSTPNFSSSPIIFFGLYYDVLLMFSNEKYT